MAARERRLKALALAEPFARLEMEAAGAAAEMMYRGVELDVKRVRGWLRDLEDVIGAAREHASKRFGLTELRAARKPPSKRKRGGQVQGRAWAGAAGFDDENERFHVPCLEPRSDELRRKLGAPLGKAGRACAA